MRGSRVWAWLWSACALACGSESTDTMPDAAAPAARDQDGAVESRDDDQRERDAGDADAGGCDLTGTWVTQHITTNSALGAAQLATNWSYHRIEQDGTRLQIVESLDCGYVVRGTTDVSLADATLEAMARYASNAVGVEGRLAATPDGGACVLTMDRIYAVRGANKARILDAVWEVGDEPAPLSDFVLPANESEGMEDWDEDGHEGITQLTGLGDRYTAQIDWHAFSGTLPLDALDGAAPIGGEGVLVADYDARESVSLETPLLLRTSSVPMPPGYGFLLRADDLEIVTSGDHPELETCKNVQARAVQELGDPPRP